MHHLSIRQLKAALLARDFSCEELARAHLERLVRIGTELNCLVSLTEDQALAEAREADRRLIRGDCPALNGITGRAQGRLLHPRSPDLVRLPNARQLRGPLRCDGGGKGPPAGHGDARQGEHGRVRHGLFEREQLLRPRAQPLGSREGARRLIGRLRRRGGRTPRARRHRHRYRRLGAPARRAVRSDRDQADLWARVPLRVGRLRIEPRSGRGVREKRGGRRIRARGDRGIRRARFDERRPAGGELRLRPRGGCRPPSHRGGPGVLWLGARSRRGRRNRGSDCPLRTTRRREARHQHSQPRARHPGVLRRRARRVLLQPVALRWRALRVP